MGNDLNNMRPFCDQVNDQKRIEELTKERDEWKQRYIELLTAYSARFGEYCREERNNAIILRKIQEKTSDMP